MAELVVRSQSRSMLRKGLETALTVSFPLWGVGSPLVMLVLLIQMITYHQSGSYSRVSELMAWFVLSLVFSISCLVAKRALAHDFISADKEGIRLPYFFGSSVNLKNYIAWKDVERISAAVVNNNPKNSRISILKKRGKALHLPISQMEPEFVEQFVLASQAWAKDVCDPSLAELQNTLRIGETGGGKQASYTELWEEELGRRFCPTSYIPLEAGKVLRQSSLKVISHLSSGGLSALYLCQLDGSKLVVLKEAVIPSDGNESIKEKAKEMFEREAKLLMKLDHSGIVRVIDSFSEGQRNYLLLEFINGVDLRQLVAQNGPQKESDVLEWAVQVALALKYMHEREQPIIHRDLTPDNLVLRNDGQVIIVDFGAANEFIGTATGTFVGKHSFIAPEQLKGKATTHSDIYSFACTLYFLLTGQEPEALLPSNPKELAPSVSDELCELIESCTQLEASDRYQTVAQMLPVLRRLAAQSMLA